MKENFETLIQDEKPVIVDFYTQWCGPCKTQSPILEDLSKELGEAAKVIKIDVEKNTDVAVKYGIQAVPTIMVFQKGEIKHRQSGLHTKAQLKGILEKL